MSDQKLLFAFNSLCACEWILLSGSILLAVYRMMQPFFPPPVDMNTKFPLVVVLSVKCRGGHAGWG